MSAQYVEPVPRSALPPRRSITWYYRGPDVAVTNQYLHIGRDRYALAELSDLGVVRGPTHPAVLISSVIAIAQTPIVIPVVTIVRSPIAFLLAAVLLVVPCAVAIVSRRRWPPRPGLRARDRGRDLALLSSHGERALGPASRGLRRAVEALPLR